jgi:hypothetical protein
MPPLLQHDECVHTIVFINQPKFHLWRMLEMNDLHKYEYNIKMLKRKLPKTALTRIGF